MRVASAPRRMRRGRSEHGSSEERNAGRGDGVLYAGGWRFRRMSASSSWSQPWRTDEKPAMFGFRRLVILLFACLTDLLKWMTISPSRWRLRLSCPLRVLCHVLCHSARASTWSTLALRTAAPEQVFQSDSSAFELVPESLEGRTSASQRIPTEDRSRGGRRVSEEHRCRALFAAKVVNRSKACGTTRTLPPKDSPNELDPSRCSVQ